MNLDGEIKLRITSEEKEVIKEMAGRYKTTMSDMIRKQIFGDMDELNKKQKFTDDQFREVMMELGQLGSQVGKLETEMNRIGVNLNQIAKYYNQVGNDAAVEVLDEWLNELGTVLNEVGQLTEKGWKVVFE